MTAPVLVMTVSGERPGYLTGVHALPEEFAASRAATFAAHPEPVRFSEVGDTRGVGREAPECAATVEG